ncbi:carbohydrate ABC transporter permease [Breznakiella homolactica]|uniref:Sugar ABC transporter permease n=1 Tax=Breznakiella homolactica TaxID=2798577 RepID=A0A7T7XLV9_9SPIR|nr:sugar ABC transporter permease [Breznakiella homolactica]QQO08623.1 sugar ABC transporter permease [Breznakiella homolactica]
MKKAKQSEQHIMNRKMSRQGFLLYLPAIIIILGIVVYPMIYALQMSFTNYRPTLPKVNLVGFTNYKTILSDLKFWQSIMRSLIFTFGSLIPQIVLGLMMASLLNHPMLKLKVLFRGLAITPWLIPTVAVAMIFRWMFHDLYGIVNHIMVRSGLLLSTKAWIAQEGPAMFLLILANVWRGTPLMITMFLAGLQGIPGELYEAAEVDGANAWTRFRHVTLPLLVPVIMVSGILRFIWTFNFYDLPWVMTGGGPAEATQTAPIYAYRRAFSGYRMGEGSAITIILFFILVLFAFLYFRVRKYQDRLYK